MLLVERLIKYHIKMSLLLNFVCQKMSAMVITVVIVAGIIQLIIYFVYINNLLGCILKINSELSCHWTIMSNQFSFLKYRLLLIFGLGLETMFNFCEPLKENNS